jgi:rhamnosyltransferase
MFEAAGAGCTYVMRSSLASLLGNCLRLQSEQAKRIEVHDWFIYAFARANGFTWIIDRFSGVRYRQHSSNELGVNQGLRAYQRRAKKLLSGWGFTQSLLIAEVIGPEAAPFIAKWRSRKRLGFFWLAMQSWQCRRRRRDRVLFATLCLSFALLGWRTLERISRRW